MTNEHVERVPRTRSVQKVLIYTGLVLIAGLASCSEDGDIADIGPDETLGPCLCDELILNVDNNRVYRDGEETTYNGKCELFYESGQLKMERPYQDGQIHGLVKEWYENGQQLSEKEFEFNLQHGYFKQWRDDGRLKYEALYLKGELDTILVNDKTIDPEDIYVN